MSGIVDRLQMTPFDLRPTANRDPSRIAVFQALNLGDLLCATPALRALRRRFSGAEIVLIGRPWARDLVERLPSVDRFIPFPGYPGIAESPEEGELRAAVWPPIDLAINMHGSGQISNGFVAALDAAQTLGYGPAADARLTIRCDWIEDEAEPIRWLRLVSAIGVPADGLSLEFPVTASERQVAASLLGAADGRPRIGLHVGASDPARRWPVESFAALGDALATRLGARIILTGSDAERSLTGSVQRAMSAPASDLAGLTTRGQFAAVVAALDLLVTNDTGASHIAAATRTPSVVLFGPSRPARWAPLDLTRHHIVDATIVSGLGDGVAALHALHPEQVAARCQAALREIRITHGLDPVRERVA
jgi:ADP-heptose:LPS heptosyltransferase